MILHCFKPILGKQPRVLILGSMPGTASLKKREYYGFPGNHFWRIMRDLLDGASGIGATRRVAPTWTYQEKISLLQENHVALWDVIASCTRKGARDSSIQSVRPNDIPGLIEKYPSVQAVFLNGRMSEKLFLGHCGGTLKIPAHYLPSTSPAHASMSYEKKLKKWSVIKKYLVNRNPWC